ncbi:RNase A-like domain-containing protein [Streptomyces sp. NPDC056987]|uniref:RNase A-like domain-containing protein n=1 Tax=Streptomyces sp. NPDC056987 TaxID=3345988 RepID=UPI00362F1F0A
MSGIGGATVPPTPPGLFAHGSGRQPLPQQLRVALILVRVLFGLTVLGGAGALMTAAAVDAVDGQLLGLLAYAAAPGVVGLVLSRWAWTGGAWVRWGLLAVQGWLLVGALGTLADGGGRGLTQLVLPLAVIVLLCHRPSRAWFLLAPFDRAEHRPFRLARMIKWRTDGGQTAAEYLGLVVVVVAVVGGLVATGVGGPIAGGLRAAVCELSGSACPAAGPNDGGGRAGGDGGGGTTAEAGEGLGSGESGGAGDPGGDGSSDGEVRAAEEKRGDAEDGKKNGGDDAKEDESCSGWAIVSCGVKQVGGFFKGAAADGFWGDVTGTFDTVMHPLDALDGIKEYGKSLGDRWSDDSKGAGDKWDKGNYLGAVWDWGKASGKTVVNVADDVFVGDEVRDMWDKGEYGRAVGTVGWNVGSLFIPGYGEAKLIGRIGKLGKDAKKAADKASDGKRKPDAEDSKKPEGNPAKCVTHSFLPSTLVLLADGRRVPIKAVRVGELVTATDPVTGLTTARRVVDTITTHDDKRFTRLTVLTPSGTAVITATDTHPFWLTGQERWVEAGDIRPGAALLTPTGGSLVVTGVDRYARTQTTQDLTVDDIHTYYVGVGNENVLVHNCGGDLDEADRRFPGQAHTLDEHVDVSPQRMRELAEKKGINSKWVDRQTAQQAVDYALAKNKDYIAKRLAGLRDGEQLTLPVQTFGARNPLGRYLKSDGTSGDTGNRYTVILKKAKKDPSGRKVQGGYYVYTAYPV